jgi:hypothetical protein
MRPSTTALIATIALIVVACGGDDSTSPTPATQSTATPPAAGVMDGPPAATGAAEETAATDDVAAGAVEYVKSAKHSSADDPGATYDLVSGRYRFAWNTPTENPCSRVEIAVTQVDGDFQYKKASTSARFNATVNGLPQGTYKLEQLDPTCTEWDLRIDWMTN